MNKTIGLVVGAVLVAGAAFAGGYYLSGFLGGGAAAAPGARGGAFAQLTEAERTQMQNMTDEERQAFFKEKGIDMPSGGPQGQNGMLGGDDAAAGGGPGGRTSLLEGVVASIDGEKVALTLTAGGSANAYVDDATVLAATEGKTATLEKGAAVLVYAEPEAAGVSAAKVIVIK